MSGIVGGVTSRTGTMDLSVERDHVAHQIYHGTFNFQYGGANYTANYTLPETAGRQWYLLRENYSDARWSSEAITMNAAGYYGVSHNLYNHWNTIVIATTGVVSITNGNGGTSGNLLGEIRIWEIESERLTSFHNLTD